MPRHKMKMDNKTSDATKMRLAIRKVLDDEWSVRAAAISLDINRMTLHRYIKKYQETAPEERKWMTFTPNHATNMIFTPIIEEKLKVYLMSASKMHYGLTRKNVMQLAYQLAIANNLYCPKNWHKYQSAGDTWCQSFVKRHSELSLRKPDETNFAQSDSINHTLINTFFDNLESAYEELGANISPSVIYNLDETLLSTVHIPTNVIALKDQKQVSQVTACCIIAANGDSIPPYLVFPLVHFEESLLNGAPPGSSGGAATSGCMNAELFLEVLEHFQKHARASVEKKVILILDNHESHITIKSLDFCKENGIILLTLPPHVFYKLQPIGHTVYKSLKSAFNTVRSERMFTNESKTISIHEVAELFGIAYPCAFTSKKIKKGFESTGIWKLNRNICKDDESLWSSVTDRIDPVVTEIDSP